ncbi:MAG: EmrB/QacA family drug resistance transporter, partial [Ktedonobacterales bacterium]
LLPMMAGLLLTSTLSGQLISRWGRYKVFPIVGTAVVALGMFLLSRMDEHTSTFTSSINMLILGLGLGLVMQVLVIVVQNAVAYRDLGVATSGATFFRSIGGSFGVAIFGAIFSSVLTAHLHAAGIPAGASGSSGGSGGNPAAIQHLPPVVRDAYVHAYAISLQPVFLIAAAIAVVAFALTWFLPEVPMRATATATDTGEVYAMPEARSSREEIERALSVLASRDGWRHAFQRLAAQAGVALTPEAGWLLCQFAHIGPRTPEYLSGRLRLPVAALAQPLKELTQAGLVASAPQHGDGQIGQNGPLTLTPAGQQAHDRLVAAQRSELDHLLEGWSPDQESELAALLTNMAQRLLTDDAGDRALVAARPSAVA